jgi:UDP-3-O-[3-hydroxymyristoyl] N-acetylglucosamine deacetylase / 3-hydroxyacyl-[acyl-carrier-protein] dehydratase
MNRQTTIRKPVTVEGRGLFTGQPCVMQILPAQANAGIVFVRANQATPIIAAIDNVAKRQRRTSLQQDEGIVETVEHVLAAAAGMGIDNLRIELTAAETPSTDGSALPFVEALAEAGVEELDAEQKVFVITEPVSVSDGDAMLAALPGPTDCLDILFDLDYGSVPSIGRQVMGFRLGEDNFAEMIAPARTFSLAEEAQAFQAQGIGTHLTPRDVLIMGPDGPIENDLRFPDEHVRHKITDLIGDLGLLGQRVRGRIVAYRSGHELNHQLVQALTDSMSASSPSDARPLEPIMDVRKIMRLLPHRYPFLMIDRLQSLEGDQKAIGIKNVTINEPYFQGHYPGQPIMPGVMILEAMAQLSGILLSRRLEHVGKVAVLLSMDRVKMRRPVRPGDQLILEAEAIHVRPRTGHCRCRALVDGDVSAEAEIKFMLVDAEPA